LHGKSDFVRLRGEPTVSRRRGAERNRCVTPATAKTAPDIYRLAFIEFDEQGDFWDREQLRKTVQAIRFTGRLFCSFPTFTAGKTIRATPMPMM
jgi:hypothetical protein